MPQEHDGLPDDINLTVTRVHRGWLCEAVIEGECFARTGHSVQGVVNEVAGLIQLWSYSQRQETEPCQTTP